MIFNMGRIFPINKSFNSIYWEKRPSISPEVTLLSLISGNQSWLPHIKLRRRGEKLKHKINRDVIHI